MLPDVRCSKRRCQLQPLLMLLTGRASHAKLPATLTCLLGRRLSSCPCDGCAVPSCTAAAAGGHTCVRCSIAASRRSTGLSGPSQMECQLAAAACDRAARPWD